MTDHTSPRPGKLRLNTAGKSGSQDKDDNNGQRRKKSVPIKVREPSGRKPSKQAQELSQRHAEQGAAATGMNRRQRRQAQKSSSLHPRNPHQGRYDIEALVSALPELAGFIKLNPAGEKTIDFSDQQAVVCLNRALLKQHYQLDQWQIPPGYLCPPIPGRADYIHYAADLVVKHARREVKHERVKMLDIGCGANLIYSLLGHKSYGWQAVGTDIDSQALENAATIIGDNQLADAIELRTQNDSEAIFDGVIKDDDFFHLCVCNPPFYASAEEARFENQRKVRNLQRNKQLRSADLGVESDEKPDAETNANPSIAPAADPANSNDPWAKAKQTSTQTSTQTLSRNFGGNQGELWCEGGELAFLKRMVRESKRYAKNVGWFTSLVSKQENVDELLDFLKRQGASKTEVVKMTQGQKISRFLAWRFKV